MADPDQDKEGGSSRPWDKGGGSLQKKYFRPFGPQFGLKIRGAQVTRVPPLDPPLLYSKMAFVFLQIATAVPGEHAVLDYTKSDGKLPMMILHKWDVYLFSLFRAPR